MKRKKILLILLLGALLSPAMHARKNLVGVEALMGDNSSYGFFYGSNVKGFFELPSNLRVQAAFRYLSFPRAVVDVRPAYVFELPFGNLAVEGLAQYAYQSSTDDICAGVGFGLKREYFWVDLGVYYRQFSASYGGTVLREPFNLMYEIGVSGLPFSEKWDLFVVLTTKRLGALERFYSPSALIETVFSPSEKLSFVLSMESKPSGIFNIAETSYQLLSSIGVKYTW